MAFISSKSNIKVSILGFIKHLVSKSVYNDIKSLLEPCCKPTLTFESMSCGWTQPDGGVYGTRFLNAEIMVSGAGGQTVTAILTTSAFSGGVCQHITLDAYGKWTGTLQSSWETSNLDFTATLYILKEGSKTLLKSDPIRIINMPNCD